MGLGQLPRLLLAEDEEDIIETVTALLDATLPGVAIDVAHNGLEALDLLKTRPYDLLLTDYKMPRMDGVQLLRKVHESYPDLRVLMYTAFMDAEFMGRVHEAVPDLKVIPKPLDIDFFLKHVKDALGLP
jgi:YesN/AraC family two-component response regulator